MNGSASRPSSATMNGTHCAIRPATNGTSRDSRSSFDSGSMFRQRRVEMQHERVSVAAEFGDDERHALGHEAGNERDIARQPVKL